MGQADHGRHLPEPDRHPMRRQPRHHRGGDERQAAPGGEPGPRHHRLPAADDRLRLRQAVGKPCPGGRRDLPILKDHGQGAERSCHLFVPAFPCRRKPPGQAAHHVGPA